MYFSRMINPKDIFADSHDEIAEKIGASIAKEMMLKPSREYPDRYELDGGTFTNKGVARRVARFFVEFDSISKVME